MDLTENLVAYWACDGHYDLGFPIHDSKGANHLTTSNLTKAAGRVSTAAGFNRVLPCYASIASTPDLQMGANQSFQIAFWVKFNSLTGGAKQLVTKYKNAAPQVMEYYVLWNATTERFEFGRGSGGVDADIVSADTFGLAQVGTWYFVMCQCNVEQRKLSIGVISMGDFARSFAGDSVPLTEIGAATDRDFRFGDSSDGAGQFAFDGSIDEVAIWKRLLTFKESSFLYNSGNGRSFAELQPKPCQVLDCCREV